MPLYEYQCDTCGHRFEKIQKFSDPKVDECPKCGAAVHKLQSAPAIQFKGTGWYITDYAKKEGGKTGKSDEGQTGSGDKADKSDKGGQGDKTETSTPSASKAETTSSSSAGGSATSAPAPAPSAKPS